MAITTINQKIVGDNDPDVRKILATDVNQIREAIQTGTKDIAPNNILMEGTSIGMNSGNEGLRYDTGTSKVQYSDDGTSWNDMGATADNTLTVTAGEDLAIRDVVYMSTSDGKLYKCDADDSTKVNWLGVMSEAVLTDATGTMYLNNSVVGGFSGLTTGTWYEISSTAGEITAGEGNVVGIAISVNQIKLMKLDREEYSSFLIKNKDFTDATEYSQTGTTWTDKTSFTITSISGAEVIGGTISVDLKTSNATNASEFRIKVTGTNIGTEYIVLRRMHTDGSGIDSNEVSFGSESVNSTGLLLDSFSTSYVTINCSVPTFEILDTTTTFTLQMRNHGIDTAYLDEVDIRVLFVDKLVNQ